MDIIHIAIITLIFIFFVLSLSKSSIDKYLSSIIFFIYLVVFSSLRDIYWGDTNNYRLYYLNSSMNSFESGFEFITKLFYNFDISFTTFLLFYSILNAGIYTYAILKWSKYICNNNYSGELSLVFLISIISFHTYYMNFEAVRDGLSSGIILLSLYYLIIDKRVIFILLVLLASMFHSTAFIFLLLPILRVINLNIRKATVILSLSCIFSFFILKLLLWTNLLPNNIIFLIEYYSVNTSNSKTVIFRYLIIILIFYYLYLKYQTDKVKKIFTMYIWMISIFLLFITFPDMARRLLIKLEYISYPVFLYFLLKNMTFKAKVLIFSFGLLFYTLFFSNYISFYNLLNIESIRGIYG